MIASWIAHPAVVRRFQNRLLSFRRLLGAIHDTADAVVDSAELLDQTVDFDQAEPDANGTEQLSRRVLQGFDAILSFLLRRLIDIVAELEAYLPERSSQSLHPFREFLGSTRFHIPIHLVECIELQSFVQRVAGLQLPHGCELCLDEHIHSHFELGEAGQVQLSEATYLAAV